MSSANRKPGIHVAWTTVTYRSMALLILAVAAVFFIAVRATFPQFTANSIKKADDVAGKLLERVAGMAPATGSGSIDRTTSTFHRSGWNSAREKRNRQ